jgi:NAD(P)-dependent dehydrogenase (short-subunit alcohol dehydrogenase family)
MQADFTGRVAMITGARRGLGMAAAKMLLARGAAVAVNARRADQAEAVAAELMADRAAAERANGTRGVGGRAIAVPGDVADAAAVNGMVERVLERFGRLDVLVNNAALALSTRFERIDEAEWRSAIEVNLTAVFLCTRAAVPAMKASGYGRIVNVSSTAGKSVSTLGGAHYTASKAGLLGLTRAAAKELGPHGITVNAVCPGLIDTELTREHATAEELAAYCRTFPVPRLGTPEEVADLICFLASDRAGYITGASVDINGGDLMI